VTLAALTTASGPALGPATTAPPTVTPSTPPPEAEQDRLARLLAEQRFWALPAFFGFGLLLAFTPCVFPMVPILSSLIAGQGKAISERRALLLSLIYVLAMALTYTVAGILAALLGQNLQALFQHPLVIITFSLLFVVLALAMFGLFHLQLPAHWQSRLSEYSHRHHDGGYLGVAVMGLLSALIIGPCVAPPLVGVLMMIASTGDVGLGALALFVMALGMGTPLLLIGASAGRLLPKVGPWMTQLQAVFGVLLLAVAIWLLERLLPAAISMLLWATLLIVCATYLGALQPLDHGAPAWRMLIKGLGMVLLLYGFLLLVGVAAGGRDVWQPLRGVGLLAAGRAEPDELAFRPVKTVAELEAALRTAKGRPVLLDFYADWCVSCKELERYTFGDPAVRMALADTVLLRADVTANDDADRALLQRFGLIGPPVILFFDRRGEEQRAYRVVGFVAAEPFQAHLARVAGVALSPNLSPASGRGE
jgi:thiol:disulfide interchange protein DsbD